MKLRSVAARMLLGRWKGIVTGALAVLMLLPVPAVAITLLGSWQFFQHQVGGAPTPQVSSQDFAGGGSLTIGMGSTASSDYAESAVLGLRDFQVRKRGELVTFIHSFESTLRNFTEFEAHVLAVPYDGSTSRQLSTRGAAGAGEIVQFRHRTQSTAFMGAGRYQMIVLVAYAAVGGKGGGWSNASPHTFTFTGM